MDQIGRMIRSPVVVIGAGGAILEMNPSARRVFGPQASRWDQVFADGEALRELLALASGMSEPAPGALRVRQADGTARRSPVQALALRGSDGSAFAVEVRDQEASQFAALNGRLKALNTEILTRRRAQAQLEESLARNETLYRELQHRVKNHLQMMLALVSATARECVEPTERARVETLRSKLAALFDVQRLMYGIDNADGVPADQMLIAIARTVEALAGGRAAIRVQAERFLAPNDTAFPLALIANELLTNAVKHGAADGSPAEVEAVLRREGDEAVLEVRDHGPGFVEPAPSRAASGLGLVRGLCRQIGGRLEIASESGARIAVIFPIQGESHVRS